MSKITFSSDDIDILNRNTNILRVSEKSITYTDEFKRHFIEEYLAGKLPRVIFEEAGFDINMIGIDVLNNQRVDGLKHIMKMVSLDYVIPGLRVLVVHELKN